MDNYERFFKMLNRSKFKNLWDEEKKEMKPDFGSIIPCLSHGEKIMAQFFAAIWLGNNKYGFDVIEAAQVLDLKNRQIIDEWIVNPFFP